MCFSAKASFAAAGILSTIGILSIQKAKKNKIALLAASPIFFAIQQGCEGIVWISLNNHDTTSPLYFFGMYGFLFFAGTFWPIWMPSTLYIVETNKKRKTLLLCLSLIGILTGLLFFISWTLQTSGAHSINHHIDYPVINYPFNIANKLYAQCVGWILSILYCITTLIPFFISSIRYLWAVGIIITAGFIVSAIFYYMAFSSVWCFFAAIGSCLLYFVIAANKKG